jgi:hypothetical protein
VSIAEVVGIYAAVVSTCSVVWLIIKDRPRIKLNIIGIAEHNGERVLSILVINTSTQIITLDSFGLVPKPKKRKYSFIINQQISGDDRIVAPRAARTFEIPLELLDTIDEKREAATYYVIDATNRKYKKKIPVIIKKQMFLNNRNVE